MRDPARIPLILARLQAIWETMPDMRLAQLLAMCDASDPFYIEDEPLLEKIETTVATVNRLSQQARKPRP